MQKKFNIGVTSGDINGIGFEVLAKYLNSKWFEQHSKKVNLFFFFDRSLFENYFKTSEELIRIFESTQDNLNQIQFIEVKKQPKIEFGKISKESGRFAFDSMNLALEYAKNGIIQGVVTLPICKESVQLNKSDFIGHTEFFANFFYVKQSLMMFIYKKFRIALLTNHLPIGKLSNAITSKLIIEKSIIFYNTLEKDFDIKSPKIAILGLNPHSGEDGLIGDEEIRIFLPAINQLKEKGIIIEGPFPSDAFFAFNHYKNFDGILACYHDQGLIPFKLITQGKGVNYTANLPIVRCSPDHGTAFDIAGKGIASFESIKNSFEIAIKTIYNRFEIKLRKSNN